MTVPVWEFAARFGLMESMTGAMWIVMILLQFGLPPIDFFFVGTKPRGLLRQSRWSTRDEVHSGVLLTVLMEDVNVNGGISSIDDCVSNDDDKDDDDVASYKCGTFEQITCWGTLPV